MAIIGHIILNVKDFEKSSGFYDVLAEALNFQANYIHEGDWGIMKSYRNGEHNFWIRYDKEAISNDFVRNVGLDHLAFRVESKDEVDVIYSTLLEKEVLITRAPRNYPEYADQYYAFYFRDPDGIPLEIYFE
ncbi:MAG: VOC family protein [Chitinophagales bacterium]